LCFQQEALATVALASPALQVILHEGTPHDLTLGSLLNAFIRVASHPVSGSDSEVTMAQSQILDDLWSRIYGIASVDNNDFYRN